MPTLAIALPLLGGKEAALRRFAAEVEGPRKRAFDDSEKRLGVTEESWFLQRAPGGDLVVVTASGADPLRALLKFSESKDPFDLWFKAEVKGITGVDLNGPLPPPPEELVRYPPR